MFEPSLKGVAIKWKLNGNNAMGCAIKTMIVGSNSPARGLYKR